VAIVAPVPLYLFGSKPRAGLWLVTGIMTSLKSA